MISSSREQVERPECASYACSFSNMRMCLRPCVRECCAYVCNSVYHPEKKCLDQHFSVTLKNVIRHDDALLAQK